jgi:hypothetical protein
VPFRAKGDCFFINIYFFQKLIIPLILRRGGMQSISDAKHDGVVSIIRASSGI